MKKIFKKNQLIITALALMIAVAGYFSYMNNNIEDPAAKETVADVLEEDYEISDEDSLVGEIFTDEGTGEEVAVEEGTETAALDEGGETADEVAQTGEADSSAVAESEAAVSGETTGEGVAAGDVVENPGEAVFTSTAIHNLDYAAEMKLNREQRENLCKT